MSGTGRRKTPLVADKRYPKQSAKPAAKKPAARKKPAQRPAKRRNIFMRLIAWITRLFWGVMWRGMAVGILILAVAVGYVFMTLPEVSELVDQRARGSVTLLDREGRVYAWRGDQFGGMITAETVSPDLRNAVVATEDKRFYGHLGISPRGIASAVRINLREGRGPLSGHGGSTITQQTAKLLCLGVPFDPNAWESEAAYEADCRQGSLWRKAKEAVYALAMELRYSKDDILTIYLNRAFLGAGSRGFEAAAQRYFGKSANEVNASEAAMLAGLLVAPSRYAPTNNLERSRARAETVLKLMHDQGYLSTAEHAAAVAAPASLSAAAEAQLGGYFADWVMSSGPEFFTRDTTEDVIIRSTLDQRIQRAAEEAVQHIFDTKVREGSEAQAAVVVMSADGAVRAMVGGRDTRVSGAFNRATQARRQTGSTFKPFVYAVAMDLGYSPNDLVQDTPLCMDIPGSGEWCPENFDHEYRGQMTLTQALKLSRNIPAVRVADFVGLEAVRNVANGFGLSSDLAEGPALALGVSESTLIEMTGAYAGILNGGSAVLPYGLVELSLQGDDTPVMRQEGGIRERVISQRAAQSLVYMMNQAIESGTAQRARLDGRPAAGKTGTTQSNRDAWFIGFTADYVTGVWMGYDDNTPMTGVGGGGLPADIWRETMVRVHEGTPVSALPMLVPEPSAPAVAERPRRERRPSRTDNIIEDLLRDIFGGRRN